MITYSVAADIPEAGLVAGDTLIVCSDHIARLIKIKPNAFFDAVLDGRLTPDGNPKETLEETRRICQWQWEDPVTVTEDLAPNDVASVLLPVLRKQLPLPEGQTQEEFDTHINEVSVAAWRQLYDMGYMVVHREAHSDAEPVSRELRLA